MAEKWRVKMEYFHILLSEMGIYFDQTRDDCGKANRDRFGEFCLVYVSLELSASYDGLQGN